MRLGLLAFAAIFVCAPACADATSERSFPQTVAEVQSALKNLAGGTAGSLPVLDGFVASSVTGSVMPGSADDGEMVFAPPPPMLKAITSAPRCELALEIACRSEPLPLSLVLVTE